jgi:hypothetical protein
LDAISAEPQKKSAQANMNPAGLRYGIAAEQEKVQISK